jgi:hypothetical protein
MIDGGSDLYPQPFCETLIFGLEFSDGIFGLDLSEEVGQSVGLNNFSSELLHVYVELGSSLPGYLVELLLFLNALRVHLLSPLNIFHLFLIHFYRVVGEECRHGVRLCDSLVLEEVAEKGAKRDSLLLSVELALLFECELFS